MKKILLIIIFIFASLFYLSFSSAIMINEVTSNFIEPGKETNIKIEIKNTFNEDIEDVSFNLLFDNTRFIPIGSSSFFVDEMGKNEKESFVFRIRADNDINAGTYIIPYEIILTRNRNIIKKTGTIGIVVKSQPQISFFVFTENAVINKRGKINLRIINKGFADARFLNVKLYPSGFILLSEDEVYIGKVDSDDFETASFDVIFNSLKPTFSAFVEYKDFDNNPVVTSINLPMVVYSNEEAVVLGLIKKDNLFFYVVLIFIIIFIWFMWRYISKKRRMKKIMQK